MEHIVTYGESVYIYIYRKSVHTFKDVIQMEGQHKYGNPASVLVHSGEPEEEEIIVVDELEEEAVAKPRLVRTPRAPLTK